MTLPHFAPPRNDCLCTPVGFSITYKQGIVYRGSQSAGSADTSHHQTPSPPPPPLTPDPSLFFLPTPHHTPHRHPLRVCKELHETHYSLPAEAVSVGVAGGAHYSRQHWWGSKTQSLVLRVSLLSAHGPPPPLIHGGGRTVTQASIQRVHRRLYIAYTGVYIPTSEYIHTYIYIYIHTYTNKPDRQKEL